MSEALAHELKAARTLYERVESLTNENKRLNDFASAAVEFLEDNAPVKGAYLIQAFDENVHIYPQRSPHAQS